MNRKTEYENSIVMCVRNSELTNALRAIDGLETWEGLEKALMSLQDSGMTSAVWDYAVARVFHRIEEYEKAKFHYLSAAKRGYFSGYYVAGRIEEDRLAKKTSNSAQNGNRYFSVAAEEGHIWATLNILKKKASNHGLAAKLNYLTFRFFMAPILIVRYSLKSTHEERLRY